MRSNLDGIVTHHATHLHADIASVEAQLACARHDAENAALHTLSLTTQLKSYQDQAHNHSPDPTIHPDTTTTYTFDPRPLDNDLPHFPLELSQTAQVSFSRLFHHVKHNLPSHHHNFNLLFSSAINENANPAYLEKEVSGWTEPLRA